MESLHIPGLALEAEIGRGAESVVYLARKDGRSYAVKVHTGAALAGGFRREAALIASVQHPGLAAILEVGEAGERPYLVMEYVEGSTLAERIRAGPLAEHQVVEWGAHLAGALGAVHARGLVHRDVKPHNVILSPSGVKLIDFGFAFRVEAGVRDLAGSPSYAAPEQLGLGAGPVDPRADLYSLGVVLFEALTGRTPFEVRDPRRLMQEQLHGRAPALSSLRSPCSRALDAIVAKLLERRPEDRYQSAGRLAADLERIELIERELREGRRVALGAADVEVTEATELSPLVGRAQDFAALRHHWKQALRGVGSVVLIEGEPGVGKTRLARELVYGAERAGALVLSAACAEPQNPFESIRSAVEGYLARVARFDEGVALTRVITDAAGPDAALVGRLTPALERVLAASAARTSSSWGPDPFFAAVAAFLSRLAASHPAAILFLDDAHWIDPASASILVALAERLADTPLVVVLAARTRRSPTALDRLVSELGSAVAGRLELGPLSEDAVAQLLARDLLGRDVDPVLARRVAHRAGGNPLAVALCVDAMLDAGVVRPAWGRWIADLEGFDRLELPSDVVEIVLARTARLDEPTLDVLTMAAVIGPRFDGELLARCLAGSSGIGAALTAALDAQVIERQRGTSFAFQHPRTRESILERAEPETLRAMHQRVADSLGAGGDAETVYARARHAWLGDLERFGEAALAANLEAGRRAVEEFADESARAFYRATEEIAARLGRQLPPEVFEQLAELSQRTGRLRRAAEYYERSLALVDGAVPRAELRAKLALVYVATSDFRLAWDAVERGFAELGVRLPKGRSRRLLAVVRGAFGVVSALLGKIRPADPRRAVDRARAGLYEIGTLAAFYRLDEPNLALMVGSPLRPALRYGVSRELVNAFVNYAMLATGLGFSGLARRCFERAEAVNRALEVPAEAARTAHVRASAAFVVGRVLECRDAQIECLDRYGGHLEPLYFLNACTELAWIDILRGCPDDAHAWMERARERSSRVAHAGSFDGHTIAAYAATTLAMLGRVTEAQARLHRFFLRAEDGDEPFRTAEALAHSIFVSDAVSALGAPLEQILADFGRLGLRPDRAPVQLRHFWVFAAHAALERARQGVPVDLLRARAALRLAAAGHPLLEAHLHAIEGASARLEGAEDRALGHLAAAEQLAREVDAPWVLTEVARERALAARARGDEDLARREASVAVAHAERWKRRRRQIEAEFGLSAARPESDSASVSFALQRHFAALLKVSLASATEVDPKQRARVALDEIVSVLKAERAYLLFAEPDSDALVLEVGRDRSGADIPLEGYSNTVVEAVRRSREPIIVNGTEDGTEDGMVLGSDSAVVQGLRSIAAAPLILRDRLVGVVYLDNRIADGVFTEDDVDILLALASHVAIALETVRTAQLGTYERVGANLPGMVFQLSMRPGGELRFDFASDGVRDLFGVDAAAVLADPRALIERLHPADRSDWRRSIQASAKNLAPWRWEGRTGAEDAEKKWVQVAASPERQADGTVMWSGLIMDITTRRAAEDRLEAQATELRRSNEDLEQFAYAASHDLQEPLRVVASYLQLLERRYGDRLDGDAKEFIDYAVDGAIRMQGMIKDLLQYSRAGSNTQNLEAVDLEEVMGEVRANLATAIEESGARIEVVRLPTVYGDRTQLVLLLQNLVGNAVKFRGLRPPRIALSARLVGEDWEIEVADNGIGIEPAMAERVFGLFTRLHTRTEYPGSGVGLAICKKIVERHGGRIWVAPRVEGTAFVFRLPSEAPDLSEPRLETAVGSRPGAP